VAQRNGEKKESERYPGGSFKVRGDSKTHAAASPGASGKMIFLSKLFPRLAAEGHRKAKTQALAVTGKPAGAEHFHFIKCYHPY
jgi:hypothetical protein